MSCDFTLSHYEELCKKILKSDYKICFFNENIVPFHKILIMRHDIDLSLEHSLTLAELESEQNIKSTYFIWLTSPFYNVFENKNRKIIQRLVQLGHQIGLHFDEKAYSITDKKVLNFYINKEAMLLRNYFDVDIYAVSMHKPSNWILNQDIHLDNYINAYSKKYFNEFKYISDSNMRWREECACLNIDPIRYENICILTHPIWWADRMMNVNDVVKGYIKKKSEETDIKIAQTISAYNNSL